MGHDEQSSDTVIFRYLFVHSCKRSLVGVGRWHFVCAFSGIAWRRVHTAVVRTVQLSQKPPFVIASPTGMANMMTLATNRSSMKLYRVAGIAVNGCPMFSLDPNVNNAAMFTAVITGVISGYLDLLYLPIVAGITFGCVYSFLKRYFF